MREPLFIDGQWREPARGASLDVRNPATEAVFAQAAAGTAEDVDAAVRAARRAFDEGPWPRMTAGERGAILRRAANLISQRQPRWPAWRSRTTASPSRGDA